MWVIAVFDFPRHCRSGRKNMSDFVAELEKDGFSKIQRGMYARYCTTIKNGNMHKARIATAICPRSTICLFSMADREFNEIYSHFGSTKPPKSVQAECCKNKFICFYC